MTSLLKHLRDILILPFTVTCIVPYFIYDKSRFTANGLLTILGLIFFCLGILLFFYTVFLFGKIAKGTLAPWSEKQKLVVVGPYRYCRNPMITGVLLMLLGEALFLHSFSVLIWSCIFFICNTIYFILSEEPALEKQFGAEYKRYKQHVPRWVPTWKAYQPYD
jgi:protein-S-isoprenylcysteine O-methyltransferase Ste14